MEKVSRISELKSKGKGFGKREKCDERHRDRIK